MRVTRIDLIRLRIPLRRAFDHAAGRRAAADTVILRLTDEVGREGLGEIQARRYVTGESAGEVLRRTGPELARRLLPVKLTCQEQLLDLVASELDRCGRDLALTGGLEGALRQLWAQREPLDEELWIGPRRRSPTTSCATVGLEDETHCLRKLAMAARFRRVGVVKIKVGSPGDRGRLERLNDFLGGAIPLRLDANGGLTFGRAVQLLSDCATLPIESLEQPFAADDAALGHKLHALHSATGVRLVADESVCTFEEARHFAATGGYQVFNLRVGKMGGLCATTRIAALAVEAGIGLVAGTMVGESDVLNHTSEQLLERCEALGYVEGLGQNKWLLHSDPVIRRGGARKPIFRLRSDLPASWCVAHEIVE